jgi:hypothetical protein
MGQEVAELVFCCDEQPTSSPPRGYRCLDRESSAKKLPFVPHSGNAAAHERPASSAAN